MCDETLRVLKQNPEGRPPPCTGRVGVQGSAERRGSPAGPCGPSAAAPVSPASACRPFTTNNPKPKGPTDDVRSELCPALTPCGHRQPGAGSLARGHPGLGSTLALALLSLSFPFVPARERERGCLMGCFLRTRSAERDGQGTLLGTRRLARSPQAEGPDLHRGKAETFLGLRLERRGTRP